MTLVWWLEGCRVPAERPSLADRRPCSPSRRSHRCRMFHAIRAPELSASHHFGPDRVFRWATSPARIGRRRHICPHTFWHLQASSGRGSSPRTGSKPTSSFLSLDQARFPPVNEENLPRNNRILCTAVKWPISSRQ